MSGLLAFDWNGTVVDDLARATTATSVVLERRGLPPVSAERFRAEFRLPLAAMFAALGISDLTDAERDWNAEMRRTRAPLSPGVAELIELARGAAWTVGVVSAAATEAVVDDVAALGLDGAFDFVWGAQANKVVALEELARTHPGVVVYVGDTEYDIECARAAGAVAVAYGSGYRPASALRDAGADLVITSFVELALVLDGLGAADLR